MVPFRNELTDIHATVYQKAAHCDVQDWIVLIYWLYRLRVKMSEIMPKWIIYLVLLSLLLGACNPQTQTSSVTETVTPPLSASKVTPTLRATPDPQVTTTPTQRITPIDVLPEDLDGIQIQFWHPWIQESEEAIQSLVALFNAQNKYGIQVQASSHSGELYQDVAGGLNRGNYPGIVAAPNYQIQSWDHGGAFVVDLDGYSQDPTWGLSVSEVTDFEPAIWEQDVFQGKRLGVPAYRSATVLYYNQSWAHELGFDAPPGSPDEFKEQACAAAAATTASLENPGVGGWIASLDPGTVMSWVMAFGENGINQAGDGYDFSSPQTVAAFDFIWVLFKYGCAWIPADLSPEDAFASRQGLFYSSTVAGLGNQRLANEINQSEDEWIAIPYPSEQGSGVVNLYGPSYAILKASPQQELAAWIFIRWLLQPEQQVTLLETRFLIPLSQSASQKIVNDQEVVPGQDPRVLISVGRSEPVFGSWSVGRWALSDAAAMFVDPNLTSQDIPLILADLDTLLAEIHTGQR
jgi:multiple sugar transport system substrate-binding protein